MSKDNKTISVTTDLLQAYEKFILSLANGKQQHLMYIKRLNTVLSRYQQSRVDGVESLKVDTVNSPGVDQV